MLANLDGCVLTAGGMVGVCNSHYSGGRNAADSDTYLSDKMRCVGICFCAGDFLPLVAIVLAAINAARVATAYANAGTVVIAGKANVTGKAVAAGTTISA